MLFRSLDGMAHIAEQPEFNDIGKLKHLYTILEDDELLLSILKRDTDEKGTRVYIGSEMGDDFSECSLVASNYYVGDVSCGALGVIGPTRM